MKPATGPPTWLTFLMLVFIPPVGIVLAWVKPEWGNGAKVVATVGGLIWMAAVAPSFFREPTQRQAVVAQGASSTPRASGAATLTPTTVRQATIQALTPAATPTTKPASTATTVPTATAVPEPVVLRGSGQYATDEITLPAQACVAAFTHNGRRNFAVKLFSGSRQDLLVNTIGPYEGSRPIVGKEPVILDITADGAWAVTISPIVGGGQPDFNGKGDAVSDLFKAPSRAAWEFSHDGKRNFVVKLNCSKGSDLIQNAIGPVTGSKVVSFNGDACYWEVVADGNWSLRPR